MRLQRREFLLSTSMAAIGVASIASVSSNPSLSSIASGAEGAPFQLNYIQGACMYGYAPLATILDETKKVGCRAIDIWPKVHGNQREQLDEMGEEAFANLLKQHNVRLGCITQYKLGPFGLQDEMRLASRFGCRTIVTGAKGPTKLQGTELRGAIATFIEQMKPHLEVAEETGVTIAIENHANSLVDHPDSLRYLAELSPGKHLGIAFAPYHLPQDERQLAELLKEVLPRLVMFYAWEHGHGCMTQLPKEEELLQMPGRGTLDFSPLIAELKQAKYSGWTEIFMHPFPRGIPILESPEAVTAEINRARSYLDAIVEHG